MNRQAVYLGIDTSNYTTSAAICDAEGRVLANLKVPLPVREGECGLRQSDAVFAPTRNMPILMAKCREALGNDYTPIAVGVSTTPRDAEGSYMPCFLAGQAAASAICAASDLPMYTFSHQTQESSEPDVERGHQAIKSYVPKDHCSLSPFSEF